MCKILVKSQEQVLTICHAYTNIRNDLYNYANDMNVDFNIWMIVTKYVLSLLKQIYVEQVPKTAIKYCAIEEFFCTNIWFTY